MTNFTAWQRWQGSTVVCIGAGPSVTQDDVDYARNKARVITVNNAYSLAPWADVHYSSDHDWWDHHWDAITSTCSGELWTGHPTYRRDGLHSCPYKKHWHGISNQPGRLVWGGNSGYCAMGLAHQFGAAKIILLGYDQCDPNGQGHFHGHHPSSIRKGFNWPMWHGHFNRAAHDFKNYGVHVINASRHTALECFTRAAITEVL